MNDLPKYQLDRVFDAPRDLVWRAWTEPEMLARWYGPNVETIIHQFDLEPGGSWLNEMKWDGNSNYSKMVFQEIKPPELLIWHHYSATDADWNSVTNPMMPDWPPLMLTTVVFEDMGDQTQVRLTQVPMDATPAQLACFAEAMSGMDNGWGSGYAILDQIFTELSDG